MSVQPAGSDFFSDYFLLPFEEPHHSIISRQWGKCFIQTSSLHVLLSVYSTLTTNGLTIEEAAAFQTRGQLRWLFVCILLNCHPADPLKLWNDHHLHLADDCGHRLRAEYSIDNPSDEQI